MDRRSFLRMLGVAGATLTVDPRGVLAGSRTAGSTYFGVHPFIDAHPDAVFLMRTSVASKLDSAAKLQVGLDFGRSVFASLSSPGVPMDRAVVIKPNLTCRMRTHPSYTVERSMGIVTDAWFVEGVIDAMKDLGLAGSQFHLREANCPDDLADGGYLDMAARTGADLKALNAPLASLPAGAVQWMDVPDGVWFSRIPYLWPVNAPDTFLVNIAKLKAHSMGLTLCAKNLQGTIVSGYVAHCTYYGTAMDVLPGDVRADANARILDGYDRRVAQGVPRWDRPGTTGGLWQETWATRCLDNNAITHPALHVIEGIYGRDGNFMDGPDPNGLATDFMTNVILFGRNPFHVDLIGHWIGGHEPGNFGLFHMALERGLARTINPHTIPLFEWGSDGSAAPAALPDFPRTPLRTLYLRRDYAGQSEALYHLVDEPFTYPLAVGSGAALAAGPPALGRIVPNPFRAGTTVEFELPREGDVRIDVFDAGGRIVDRLVDGRRSAGAHLVRWDSRRRAPGVYVCRMECAGVRQARTLVMIR